jgi:hypothetical protein
VGVFFCTLSIFVFCFVLLAICFSVFFFTVLWDSDGVFLLYPFLFGNTKMQCFRPVPLASRAVCMTLV